MSLTRVPGHGPAPSELAFIAQCPGPSEVEWIPPTPLVGKSGAELNRFLNGATLPYRGVSEDGDVLSEVFCSNVVQHRPAKGETPTQAEIARDLPLLWDELERVRPRIIVALGAVAGKVFAGPEVSVERMHGLCLPSIHRFPWGSPVIFLAYHPAAALHSPDLQSHFAGDLAALADGLQHGFRPRPEDTVVPDYRELPLRIEIPEAFSIDTEGWPDDPWCVTISWGAPGTGYLIRSDDDRRLARLHKAFPRARRITCHSLLADLDVLAAMGLTLPDRAMDDTMVRAYLLATEPQGLKDLAYRHLGAEQDEYRELTAEAEERAVLRHVLHHAIAAHGRGSDVGKRVHRGCVGVLKKIANPDDPRPAKKIWTGSKFSKALPPVPRVTLDAVDPVLALDYACRDADLTERLVPILDQRIQDAGLDAVYRLDMGVIPIVNRMQHVGMQVDRDHFQRLLETFEREYWQIQGQIRDAVGVDLNPNSGDQVAALLYDQLGLPRPRKMTKSRARHSTEDKYLEERRQAHPVVPLIIEARECTKLKSTYAGAILGHAQEDAAGGWVIYPHLRVTRVVSGRVSAFDPNVLAIPKHSARGKLIRQGFIAGPGRVLLSTDLSQIELRIMAHASQDPYLMRVFREGRDPHTELACAIFGIKPHEEQESEHRLPIKKVNFGDIMGITGPGLRDQLAAAGVQWPVDRCEELLRESRRLKPGVARYIASKHEEARRYGYVTDFLGRRRYCAGVRSTQKHVRLAAEREAQATPIQSGAQEVFKAWMGAIWREVITPRHRFDPQTYVEPWLQVHDDFLCVVAEEEADQVQQEIQGCLPQMLSVPVQAKGTRGVRWSEV